MPRLAHAVALTALVAAGCTFTDGRGFAHAAGSLTASFAGLDAAAGRQSADGWFKTDTSFELRLTELTLQVREVQLTAAGSSGATGSAACTFDPADPPAGCTLCHGGHCHCGDAIKSYEELASELCGGGGPAARLVATLPVDATLDLLHPAGPLALDSCTPSCDLGRGVIDTVAVVLDRLTLRGTLRDRSVADRLGGVEVELTLDVELAGAPLTRALAEPAGLDRDHPYELGIGLELAVDEQLLDGLAWDALVRRDGAIRVDATTNAAAGAAVRAKLTLTPLGVTITRADD